MKSDLAVKTENLVKTFLGIEVINRCNINVFNGSIYGLLGANGAGKTTIFKLFKRMYEDNVSGKLSDIRFEELSDGKRRQDILISYGLVGILPELNTPIGERMA